MSVADPSTFPIASPWASSDLQRIVFDDIFGDHVPANTRRAAMSIPAVARARNLIVSTIARLPLLAAKAGDPLPPDQQPGWAYRTNTATAPQLRLAWTVDDLIFYGWSCWKRTNLADGFPQTFTRVPVDEWQLTDDGIVLVNGIPQADNDVTLFSGIHEGILSFGSDTIADARDLYRMVRNRIRQPVPNVELHQVDGDPLTELEQRQLIDGWAAARRGENSGVAYTNKSIELREHGAGTGAEQLMIEARNAASLDLARLVGVAANRIDATAPKSSLNYETTQGRNLEFVDFDLALYMTPITARLSADDVVPAGQHVLLDTTSLTDAVMDHHGPDLQD